MCWVYCCLITVSISSLCESRRGLIQVDSVEMSEVLSDVSSGDSCLVLVRSIVGRMVSRMCREHAACQELLESSVHGWTLFEEAVFRLCEVVMRETESWVVSSSPGALALNDRFSAVRVEAARRLADGEAGYYVYGDSDSLKKAATASVRRWSVAMSRSSVASRTVDPKSPEDRLVSFYWCCSGLTRVSIFAVLGDGIWGGIHIREGDYDRSRLVRTPSPDVGEMTDTSDHDETWVYNG